MDMLRLALERAATAHQALEVIVKPLETHRAERDRLEAEFLREEEAVYQGLAWGILDRQAGR